MHMNMLDRLDDHACRAPDRLACVDDRHTLRFDELVQRSRTAAGALIEAGVTAGDMVGVMMNPSVDLVVAVWAILRAGAAYLPLAVDYPAERIGYMARDGGVHVVLTDANSAGLAGRVLAPQIRTVRPDEHTHDPVTEFAAPPETSPAYTIYTSGTTGSPKGVVISHGAIAHQMAWVGERLGLAPGACILLKTPISFDAAQWELLANACGATVVVAPAGIAANPPDILDRVIRNEVTHLQCVPTVWAELVALPSIQSATTLQVIASGGEALPVALAQRLRTLLPGARKINLYGPTEATINSTWFDFTDAELSGGTVPIGIPVDGCTAVVVDERDRPVADGQTGELLIGGPQLADGYRNKPDITAQRFVTSALRGPAVERYYRTGDLVRHRADGVLEFVGRNDEQVKVNGHRVETNEVRHWIEAHHWVRAAAVVPWVSPRGSTQLAAFIELDPDEAPLMDQGEGGRHHRSKTTRTQVTAQLADLGLRDVADQPRILLPGAEPTEEQRRRVFARKTYRTFTADPLDLADIEKLLLRLPLGGQPAVGEGLTLRRLGALLRWFGPFHSEDRLLPKYSYASPGALNATQIYVEAAGLADLPDGTYYFHPSQHALYRVGSARRPRVHLHLVGLPRVIQSVYTMNVREVLHFEAGHMLGVLDEVAGELGVSVLVRQPLDVGGITEGSVTASVEIGSRLPFVDHAMPLMILVQVHGEVSGARTGLYRFVDGELKFLTDRMIERRHVIAVNQRSYDLSSFGLLLAVNADAGWTGLRELGRALAHLQQLGTRVGIGFMSSGYSSLTGRDLPSARRVNELLPGDSQGLLLSYFAIAGRVSAEQLSSTGMAEDGMHMKGPEEILKDDLRAVIPQYMVPSTVHVLDRIPLSQNGKQDRAALLRLAGELGARGSRPKVPPTSAREREVARIWSEVLGYAPTYLGDDFFAQGGNSISALRMIRTLNDRLEIALGVQTLFQSPTLAELAAAATGNNSSAHGQRLLRLAGTEDAAATVLWPGLGGYPMSLRVLARELAQHGHSAYGMQARGLNRGETPHDSLDAMITDDVEEILGRGLPEPFRIVGYSFGARVAAEVAQRLSRRGHRIEELVLIAPGSPVIPGIRETDEVRYDNRYFKRVLASVFSRSTCPEYVADLDDRVTSREEFVDLIMAREPEFTREIVERIITVVEHTYRFRAHPGTVEAELVHSSLFLRARGDGPSFADIPASPLGLRSRPVMNLPYGHYEIVTAGALDVATAVLEHSMEKELI